MKRVLIIFILSGLLSTKQLLAIEDHHTLAPNNRQQPSVTTTISTQGNETALADKRFGSEETTVDTKNTVFQLQDDGTATHCSDQIEEELPSRVEEPVVEYRRGASHSLTNQFCLERKNAALTEARQIFINSLTPAIILREQAADLYEKITSSTSIFSDNLPRSHEVLTQLATYPERAKQVKNQLAQSLSEINQIRNDISLAFGRYQATSQSLQQGLQSKGLETVTASLKNIELKMLAAQRNLQTAKEVFELLELKINISSEFIAHILEEENRSKGLPAESNRRNMSQGYAVEIPVASNEKVLSAIHLINIIGEKLPGASPGLPPSPKIRDKAEIGLAKIVAQTRTTESHATSKTAVKPADFDSQRAAFVQHHHTTDINPIAPGIERLEGLEAAATMENEKIETLLKRWSTAWTEKNISAYLGCYAEIFVPGNGKTRKKWQDERTERLSKPKFITVEIKILRTKSQKNGAWRVEIEQRYVSDLYNDRIKKALDLKQFGDDLLIVREESLGNL